MSEVIPGLYISNAFLSSDPTFLSKRRIGTVINCARDVLNTRYPGIRYIRLDLDDTLDQNLGNSLEYSYSVIRNSLEKGIPVLVHCFAGVSRSSSVCIYALMRKYRIPFSQALSYMKKRHPNSRPNPAFARQLSNISFRMFGRR